LAKLSTLTVRIDRKTLDRLDEISRENGKSRSLLIAEAVRAFVGRAERQIALIKKGVESADRGDVVDGDIVESWLKSWGTPRERPISRRRRS
jgi:predicted transcriptional regulator